MLAKYPSRYIVARSSNFPDECGSHADGKVNKHSVRIGVAESSYNRMKRVTGNEKLNFLV